MKEKVKNFTLGNPVSCRINRLHISYRRSKRSCFDSLELSFHVWPEDERGVNPALIHPSPTFDIVTWGKYCIFFSSVVSYQIDE